MQEGQQNKILCELWLGCESLGDGHSQSYWEHPATSVPQRPVVSNPNFEDPAMRGLVKEKIKDKTLRQTFSKIMRTEWPSESKYPISSIVTNARLEGVLITQKIMQNALPIFSYEMKDRDIIASNGKDNAFCQQSPDTSNSHNRPK